MWPCSQEALGRTGHSSSLVEDSHILPGHHSTQQLLPTCNRDLCTPRVSSTQQAACFLGEAQGAAIYTPSLLQPRPKVKVTHCPRRDRLPSCPLCRGSPPATQALSSAAASSRTRTIARLALMPSSTTSLTYPIARSRLQSWPALLR